jgi:hypothetical protein
MKGLMMWLMPQLIKKGTEDVYRKSVEQEKGEGKPY